MSRGLCQLSYRPESYLVRVLVCAGGPVKPAFVFKAGKLRGICVVPGPDKIGNLRYIQLTMATETKCAFALSRGHSAGQDRPGGTHGRS